MAKKSVPLQVKAPRMRTRAVSPARLSFDGGSVQCGGYGLWHPQALSDAELEEARTEDGKILGRDLAIYCASNRIGAKAAEEYVSFLRAERSNFWDDESGGELAGIAIDMLMGQHPEGSEIYERRKAEAVGFFNAIFPYFAFGARRIEPLDKTERAPRGPMMKTRRAK